MTSIESAKTTSGPFYVNAEAAESFGRRLLVAHGLPEEDAATVSRCLVLADLRGVDTHGSKPCRIISNGFGAGLSILVRI